MFPLAYLVSTFVYSVHYFLIANISKYITIVCFLISIYITNTLGLSDGVRLVGGASGFEGRVEIYHNGSWGTVCDDSWDLNDGNVVCRMLGHPSAISAPREAFFGQGTGEILLDDISCEGTESDLSQCGHSSHGNHNCAHDEDAGVICSPGTEFFSSFNLSIYIYTIRF